MKEESLKNYDPELYASMESEVVRQEEHIELIASENYTSPMVMEAQGSQLTNKYAEGYPDKRYYGGCVYVDKTEKLAIERVKKLFGAKYANVQPHSGSQANTAAYMAFLKPGDKILGMSLADGGHLTHGSPVNFSGKLYDFIPYGLNKEGVLDYDEIEKLALEHRPKLILAGFSAYSRKIDWSVFRKIADKIDAYFMVDMAHVAGLVAAGLYPNPVPHAHVVTSTTHKTLAGPRGGIILSGDKSEDIHKKLNSSVFPGNQGGPLMHIVAAKAVAFKEALEPEFKEYQAQVLKNAVVFADVLNQRGYKIVSGKTENHILLIDLTGKTLTGKEAEKALEEANITTNKNSVPNDPRSPFVTSGIRIGTPAITRRGFKEEESKQIAGFICDILDNPEDQNLKQNIKQEIIKLCEKFPVYKNYKSA